MEKIPYKIYLSEDEMPKYWFNLRAKMKELPEPFVNPGTGEYCSKEELLPVFCEELVDQELNTTDEFIEIPEEIQSFYKMFRPSPLVRDCCLVSLRERGGAGAGSCLRAQERVVPCSRGGTGFGGTKRLWLRVCAVRQCAALAYQA